MKAKTPEFAKERIERFVRNLVSDSFPELNRKDVYIWLKPVKRVDFFMATTFEGKNKFKIEIHKKILRAKDKVLIGCLAHELVHVLQLVDKSKYEYHKHLIKMMFMSKSKYKKYVTMLERETDMEVVRRGLGHELLAFQRYHDKAYEAYTKEDGLTKKEIKALIGS